MSSYFPNRWPLSYINLTENIKTYIRRQQHKNFKHQDIKQKEPPQKYRLGTIRNIKVVRLHRSITVETYGLGIKMSVGGTNFETLVRLLSGISIETLRLTNKFSVCIEAQVLRHFV